MSITLSNFEDDPHARRYIGEAERHPAAFAALLHILNAEESAGALKAMSLVDKPALAGVVGAIERNADIAPVLSAKPPEHRFRQLVGVAIRLRMEELGWQTTGTKGSMTKFSQWFSRAERYEEQDHKTAAAAA